MRRSFRLTALGLTFGLAIGVAPPMRAASAGGFTAEIRRTEYGVPHIKARDFGGLGYGYGYAFAQDNLCVLAERVVTLRGDRSASLGPPGSPEDLDSDTYYRGLRDSRTVQRLLSRPAPLGPTPQLRRLVDGYVAGYNRYLRDTGVANLPDPTCRAASWVTPITATDIWTGLYDVNQLSGTSQFIPDIATATPPGDTPRPAAVPSSAPGLADGIGSNGWALGRDVTRSRGGMLLANPHFPWSGDLRFYQVHLTIPGVLDVSGASLYGTPVVEIGHTRGLAWTHTVSTAQRFVLRKLALAPGRPDTYLVDGRPQRMDRRTVTVPVRDAGGAPSSVTRTLYSSRYGPVLATGWTDTTAYAVQDANADNLRAMNEWLAMGQADNLAEMHTAQRTYQGIPFTNTIATDTAGTAFFGDVSVVPHVTDAQEERCAVDAEDVEGTVLDGARTACDPGSDPEAVVPGIFGPSTLPRLSRTDYVANSNNTPMLTNPAEPLTYPRIFGGTGGPGLRARLGLDMIDDRLDGTDGLGPAGFTLPSLQGTMLGNRDNSAELGRADVVTMCRARPTLTSTDGEEVDVRAACDVLAGWSGRADLGIAGPVLWRGFFQRLSAGPATWWRVPYDRAQPVSTPRGINGDDPRVQRALADTVREMRADGIALGATLAAAQQYRSVPVSGCPGGEGCFNAIQPAGPPGGARDVPEVVHGSSFIMAVELTRAGPRSRTILTYSESANPQSPHAVDQTVLFGRKQWVTDRFTDQEIHADPKLQITRLHG